MKTIFSICIFSVLTSTCLAFAAEMPLRQNVELSEYQTLEVDVNDEFEIVRLQIGTHGEGHHYTPIELEEMGPALLKKMAVIKALLKATAQAQQVLNQFPMTLYAGREWVEEETKEMARTFARLLLLSDQIKGLKSISIEHRQLQTGRRPASQLNRYQISQPIQQFYLYTLQTYQVMLAHNLVRSEYTGYWQALKASFFDRAIKRLFWKELLTKLVNFSDVSIRPLASEEAKMVALSHLIQFATGPGPLRPQSCDNYLIHFVQRPKSGRFLN